MQTILVDLDLLRKLLHHNKEAIKNALELFVDTTEGDMEMMNTQIKDQKYIEASRIAHSLKSRFVYLGNDDVVETVKDLENRLKNVCLEDIKEIQNIFYGLNRMIFHCMHHVLSEIKTLNETKKTS